MLADATGGEATQEPEQQSLCAFIDLVGTKNLAAADSRLYRAALRTFQNQLADLCHRIDGGHVYFFSDCAFFEHTDDRKFLDFFHGLRNSLLREGLYFKGSLSRGRLGAVPAVDFFEDRDRHAREVRRRTLSGYFFGDDAARLYSSQERMKGIGTNVHESALDVPGLDSVFSCYVPSPPTKGVQAYRDVKLQDDDMTRGNLSTLLNEFYYAKTRSRKLGRYYISPLIVWIQSMNLQAVNVSPSKDDDLVNLILNGRFDKLAANAPAVGVIYLSLLNRAHAERAQISAKLYEAVLEFAKKRRGLFHELEGIPTEILSHSARRKCMEMLSSSIIETAQEYKEIVDLIREYLSAKLDPAQIAGKLTTVASKFELATDRDVTVRAVKAIIRKERLEDHT